HRSWRHPLRPRTAQPRGRVVTWRPTSSSAPAGWRPPLRSSGGRFLHRLVNVEVTHQPGDLQEPRDRPGANGEAESTSLRRKPLVCGDEQTETARVHEVGGGEVEDQTGVADLGDLLLQFAHRCDVDLTPNGKDAIRAIAGRGYVEKEAHGKMILSSHR